MTLQQQVFESTRADAIAPSIESPGFRGRLPQLSLIFVSGALSISGTSSAEPDRWWEATYVPGLEATASGLCWQRHSDAMNDSEATRRAISELRRLSGLTWEQLGELFNVSRRSMHFWASGKPLNAGNEQKLLRILGVVRAAELGDARAARAALFDVKHGVTAFALLNAERYDEACAILGHGASGPRPALAKLSADAKAFREPLPPENLVDARNDRVHRDPGRARAARSVREKRRGTT